MTSPITCFLAAALTAACGGQTVATDGGTSDGSTMDSGTVGDGNGPPPGPDCPTPPPSSNPATACTIEGLQCEYGSDPRWTCNTIATCSNGVWATTTEKGMCPTSSSLQCPPNVGSVQEGAACSPMGITCNYSTPSDTKFCDCATPGGPISVDGGGASWYCSTPASGCPGVRPRLGATCSQPNLACNYDFCGVPDGLDVLCNASTSTWVQSQGGVCAN